MATNRKDSNGIGSNSSKEKQEMYHFQKGSIAKLGDSLERGICLLVETVERAKTPVEDVNPLKDMNLLQASVLSVWGDELSECVAFQDEAKGSEQEPVLS